MKMPFSLRPLRGLCAALLLSVTSACTTEPPVQIAAAPEGGRLQASKGSRLETSKVSKETPSPGSRCRSKRKLDPSIGDAAWERKIEGIVGEYSVGVAVGIGEQLVYARHGRRSRAPASNEKLLLSMALLDQVGPDYRIPTIAAASKRAARTVTGDLWLLGRGDPTLTADAPGYWGGLEATTLAGLAARIKHSGIRRIDGRVMGATDYFAHDLEASGWQRYVPGRFVQLPASLIIEGNNAGSRDPERAVAEALTGELQKIGVAVSLPPGSGVPPSRLTPVASVRSAPLADIVGYMNRTSNNFFAEMLGKLLGAEVYGASGTIDKGARAIEEWMRAHGVRAVANDSSGLSYKNRISPREIVRLLGIAETKPWGKALRSGLPTAGEGTLGYRLAGQEVRAKTGTLWNGASALSGWVMSTRDGHWITFSILDRNAPKTIEDRIVSVISTAHIRVPRRCIPAKD